MIDLGLAVPINQRLDDRGTVTHKIDYRWFPDHSMRWGWWADCFGSIVLTCQILGVFSPCLHNRPLDFGRYLSRAFGGSLHHNCPALKFLPLPTTERSIVPIDMDSSIAQELMTKCQLIINSWYRLTESIVKNRNSLTCHSLTISESEWVKSHILPRLQGLRQGAQSCSASPGAHVTQVTLSHPPVPQPLLHALEAKGHSPPHLPVPAPQTRAPEAPEARKTPYYALAANKRQKRTQFGGNFMLQLRKVAVRKDYRNTNLGSRNRQFIMMTALLDSLPPLPLPYGHSGAL